MSDRYEHPTVVRLCHWSLAVALTVLIPSGFEIFAAFPSFGEKVPQQALFTPPASLRLGGWLGGALQWHLTFGMLCAMSIGMYVAYQVASRNWQQVLFLPRDRVGLAPMVRYYLGLGPRPLPTGTYNALQRLAYTMAMTAVIVGVVTGVALYQPVQLSWLVSALGGFQWTRAWHFAAMCLLLAFIPGHLVMVALHGFGNFASMWTGWKRHA